MSRSMRSESSSSLGGRARTPESFEGGRRTPTTPDGIRSRAKTPETLRSRPRTAEIVARTTGSTEKLQGSSRFPRAASATPTSRLKKAKVFCEKDFKQFLARQEHHKELQARHHAIPNGLVAGLRPTPLIPILNGHGYVIQGSVYVEADYRSVPQQGERLGFFFLRLCVDTIVERLISPTTFAGKRPTWARMLPKGINSTTPVGARFQSFLQRQKDSLDRKEKRARSAPPSAPMPQVRMHPSHPIPAFIV